MHIGAAIGDNVSTTIDINNSLENIYLLGNNSLDDVTQFKIQ